MSKKTTGSGVEPEYEATLQNTVIRGQSGIHGKPGEIEDHGKHETVKIKVSDVEKASEEERALLFQLPFFKDWYADAKKRWENMQKGE